VGIEGRQLKTGLWKKAYLIEFMSEDGKNVEDSFTFSVPPESEEIAYSQRKSETKTFGGLHVDDYGMDAVKITLSGSTINQDLKLIYHPDRQLEWKTGEEEMYMLRDLLKKYTTGDKITREIYLYDLSKTRFSKGAAIKNYWRVFPGDFKIRRSSDRPFAYKYSMEFTAVDIENKARKDALGMEWVQKSLGGIKSVADKIKGLLDFIMDPVVGFLEIGQAYLEGANLILEEVYSGIADVENKFFQIAGASRGYFDIADRALANADKLMSIPEDATQKALNIGLEFYNASLRLVKSATKFGESVRSWDAVPEELLDEYRMTKEEAKDSMQEEAEELEDAANALAASAKSNIFPVVIIIVETPSGKEGSGGAGSDGGGSGAAGSDGGGAEGGTAGSQATPQRRVVLTYGHFEVALKSTDTLESLAAEYCGSPDRALEIAAYNGVASQDELSPGDAIKIPILAPSRRLLSNRICSPPDERDIYGRDIYLDSEGYTDASASGDYRLTEGVANLNQAILLRLRESVNRRIRLGAYGIRKNVSDPVAGVAYILSSIDLTVRGDPRVSEILDIRFQGNGDGLDVTVDYTDINHANGSAGGRA
jgi:RNase H-fold protein (predicted Holliday junction resolvase)